MNTKQVIQKVKMRKEKMVYIKSEMLILKCHQWSSD